MMQGVGGYGNECLLWDFDSVELAVDQRLTKDLGNSRVQS